MWSGVQNGGGEKKSRKMWNYSRAGPVLLTFRVHFLKMCVHASWPLSRNTTKASGACCRSTRPKRNVALYDQSNVARPLRAVLTLKPHPKSW